MDNAGPRCSVEIAGQHAADGARGEGPLDFPVGRTLEADKGFMAVWQVGELLQRPLQQGWVGPVQMQGTGLCVCGYRPV